MKKLLLLIILSYLLALPSGALADPLRVFVSIPPEKWLSDQLGGELVTTRVLLDKGQTPHNFQPTPSQITALFHSRLYFTVGMEFEREISRKIGQSTSNVQLVDITGSIKKISISGHRNKHASAGKAQRQDNALDPHVWLAPANLQLMAAAMATAMIDADPANAAIYKQNLQTVISTLDLLHRDIQQLLAPLSGATFLVFHPAFGYFAHAYGLRQEAVEIEGKSPSPRQLYALIRKAKADKVKVIFVQPQFDQKSALSVARAINGKVVPLDPLAGNVLESLKTMAAQIHSALKPQ